MNRMKNPPWNGISQGATGIPKTALIGYNNNVP